MKKLFLNAFILFLFACGIIILMTPNKEMTNESYEIVTAPFIVPDNSGIEVAKFLEMTKENASNTFGNITGVRFSDVDISGSLEQK